MLIHFYDIFTYYFVYLYYRILYNVFLEYILYTYSKEVSKHIFIQYNYFMGLILNQVVYRY